jgi:hypothetical protein
VSVNLTLKKTEREHYHKKRNLLLVRPRSRNRVLKPVYAPSQLHLIVPRPLSRFVVFRPSRAFYEANSVREHKHRLALYATA